TQADEEERAGVVDPEDGDGEGQPRRDGHGAEELDRGVDQGRREPVPADHETEGDPDDGGDEEALEHATGRVENVGEPGPRVGREALADRKSTRLNSSHDQISYAVFCLKKKIKK